MSHILEPVHVAVGVIVDHQNRVLIARRPDHLHQGGLWEFPGGKVEQGETVEQALHREIYEELGIEVIQTQRLIQIEHAYDDKRVLLDVHTVVDFAGEAKGREDQAIHWVDKAELGNYTFPAANRGIIRATQLPPYYMITGEYQTLAEYIENITDAVKRGVWLIQFRARHLDAQTYTKFATEIVRRYQHGSTNIILNTEVNLLGETHAAGQHLTSHQLYQYQQRPIGVNKMLSASVHNESELQQAMRLEVDFIVLSPVQKTTSHPDAMPMGWDRFTQLASMASCPVYALGGLELNDLDASIRSGAQGLAGITMFTKN